MALVKEPGKKSAAKKAEGSDEQQAASKGVAASRASHREAELERRRARTLAKQQQGSERIAAASTQLANGINEAASAVEELKRSMDQISSGAEEAAGASQESLQAVTQSAGNILLQKEAADLSLSKTTNLQDLVKLVSTEIGKTVDAISVSADRQVASVAMVAELEKHATDIGEIVKTVVRIADQTNLLALNAAIEAASAGQHGKGFAVVADEVRALAETSEHSATEISELVAQIQQEVGVIAEGINSASETIKGEVDKGKTITEQLEQIRVDLIEIQEGAQNILTAAEQADRAAEASQKGAEDIASAAEEQSSACEESLRTLAEQTEALAGAEQASQDLADMSDDLRSSTDIAKSAEDVAASAEELSSSVQEVNRAAGQISAALSQILRSATQQSAATEESSAAIAQIEKSADMASSTSGVAVEKGEAMTQLLTENKLAVDELIDGVIEALGNTKQSAGQINALEVVARKIDKIVDSINTIAIKTSMLAVSGSIEAARAGEFGKGFVVVSTDIRNLASESSDNADLIKDTVKAVQDQISVVRRDLEEISTAATAEVEKTRAITTNLVTMEEDMAAVLDGNKKISTSAEEISAGITQVKKAIDQIASTAEEAQQAASQASVAAEQQSKGTEDLAGAIEEIASLADELQSS